MITRTNVGIALGCAMVLTVTLRAQADQPCENCTNMFGPGSCPGGTDNIPSSEVELGLNFSAVCGPPDATIRFAGPFTVQRQAADGGVIDLEITDMVLTAVDGTTLVAGAGLGQGGVLQASLGTITDNGDGTGHSTFNMYFEVDTGGGTYLYNWDPLALEADIGCLPPASTFTVDPTCMMLYLVPPGRGVPRGDPESVLTPPVDFPVIPHHLPKPVGPGCEKIAEDVDFDGTVWDSLYWCAPNDPNFDFNWIEVHVGKPDIEWKLSDALGVCKSSGAMFWMNFVEHEDNADGSNPHHEVWGAFIPKNCMGSVDVYLQVAPGRPPDWKPVIKGVLFEHRGPPKIPTLPEWGLIGLTLLVLTAGTVVFGRRRRAAA